MNVLIEAEPELLGAEAGVHPEIMKLIRRHTKTNASLSHSSGQERELDEYEQAMTA